MNAKSIKEKSTVDIKVASNKASPMVLGNNLEMCNLTTYCNALKEK